MADCRLCGKPGAPPWAEAGVSSPFVAAPGLAEGHYPLSMWVAASEGTALGKPEVCAKQQGEGDLEMYIDFGGAFGGVPRPSRADEPDVWIAINVTEARVYLARDGGGLHERCRTPQALRLCLAELAS